MHAAVPLLAGTGMDRSVLNKPAGTGCMVMAILVHRDVGDMIDVLTYSAPFRFRIIICCWIRPSYLITCDRFTRQVLSRGYAGGCTRDGRNQ